MQGESNSSKSRNAEDEACARELLVLGGRAAAAKKGKAAAAASSATSISNVKLASSKNKHQVPQSPGIATHIVLDNSEIMNGNAIMDDTFTFITGDSDTSAGSLSMASMEPTLNSAILTTTTDTKAGQRIVMHLPPSGHHANGGNLSHHHQSFAHALDGNLTDAESSDEDESNAEQDSKPKKAVVSGDAANVSVQQESSSTTSHSTGSGSSSVVNVTNAITGSSSSQQASSGLLDLSTPKLSDTSTEDVDENQPIDYTKKTLSCSSSSSSNTSSSSSNNTSANSSLVSPNNLASKPPGKPSGSSSGSSFKILSVESLLSRSPPRSKLQHHSTTKQLESASKTTPYHPENTDTIAGKSSDPKVQVQKTKVVLEPTPAFSSSGGDLTTALESSSPPKSVKDAALRKPEPQPLSVKPSPSAPPAKPETEISAVAAGPSIPSKPEVEAKVQKASKASPSSSSLPIVPPSIAGWSDDPPVVKDTKKAAPPDSTDFQMPSAFAFGGSKISKVSAGMSLPVQPQTTLSHNPFSSRKPVVIEAKPLSVKPPSAPAKPETEMSAVAALPTVKKPDSGKSVQPVVQSKVSETDKGLPVDVDKSLVASSNKLQEPAIKVKDPVLPKTETIGETFAKKPESKAIIGPAATPSVLEPKKPLSVKPSSAPARPEPEISTVSKVQPQALSHNPFSSRKPVVAKSEPEISTVSKVKPQALSHNPFSSRKPVVAKPETEISTVSKAPDSNEIVAVQNRTVKAVSIKQPASNVSKSVPAPVSSEIQIVLDPSNYIPKKAKVMPIATPKTASTLAANQTSSDEMSKVSIGQAARVRLGETISTSHGIKTVKSEPDVPNLSAKMPPETEVLKKSPAQPFTAEVNVPLKHLNESQSEKKEQVQQQSFQPGTVTSSFASRATNPPTSKKEVIESSIDKHASSETKTSKKEGDKAVSASPISGNVSLQSKEKDHRSEDLQGKYSL